MGFLIYNYINRLIALIKHFYLLVYIANETYEVKSHKSLNDINQDHFKRLLLLLPINGPSFSEVQHEKEDMLMMSRKMFAFCKQKTLNSFSR